MTGQAQDKTEDGYQAEDSAIEAALDPETLFTELDFSHDYAEASFRDLAPERDSDSADDYVMAPAASTGGPDDDDLAPEILIKEDGSLSPWEPGEDRPADQVLRVVDADNIGAGVGLDEAELAELDPLDKRSDTDKHP